MPVDKENEFLKLKVSATGCVVWSSDHIGANLLLSEDGLAVAHMGDGALREGVRGTSSNVIWWEIEAENMGPGVPGCSAWVGLCSEQGFQREGNPVDMIAIHPFHHPAPRCDVGDRFGVGLDIDRKRVIFYKNRVVQEIHPIPPPLEGTELYPFISNFTRRIKFRSVLSEEPPDFSVA